MRFSTFLVVALLLMAGSLHARTLETSYLTLEVPETWSCQALTKDWTCLPKAKEDLHKASLIVTAKQAGPAESLASFKAELSQPRTILGKKRQAVTSKLEWIKEVQLSGVTWMEASHLNREVEGFRSYYAVTRHGPLTVLVTLSYKVDQTKKFDPILAKIRNSIILKPAQPWMEPTPQAQAPTAPQPVTTAPLPSSSNEEPSPTSPLAISFPMMLAILAGLIAIAGAAWWLKKDR